MHGHTVCSKEDLFVLPPQAGVGFAHELCNAVVTTDEHGVV